MEQSTARIRRINNAVIPLTVIHLPSTYIMCEKHNTPMPDFNAKYLATGSYIPNKRKPQHMNMQITNTNANAAQNRLADAIIISSEQPLNQQQGDTTCHAGGKHSPTPTSAVPDTLYAALMLAVKLEEERLALISLVESLEEECDRKAEKTEFYDYLTNTDELFNTTVAAKTMGIGKTTFRQLLRALKVLMPSGNKKNLPYQKHINAGRLAVKWIPVVNRQTGERRYIPVPLFTGKGLIWIKQLIERNSYYA